MAMSEIEGRELKSDEYIVILPTLERATEEIVLRAKSIYESNEIPLTLVIRMIDSTLERVRAFGFQLLHDRFPFSGDILVQLAEHPEHVVEGYVAKRLLTDSEEERLSVLVPYFKRVLSRVNMGRINRDLVLTYIREQALKNESNAQRLLPLLEWICSIHVVSDNMYSLETLCMVQDTYPNLSTSIQL